MSRGIFIQHAMLKRQHGALLEAYADTVQKLLGHNVVCKCLCKMLVKERAKNVEFAAINNELIEVLESVCKDCANINSTGGCDLIPIKPCPINDIICRAKRCKWEDSVKN